MLIDVANYEHVEEGPGILLIAHEADYALNLSRGRLGLLYTRKRSVPASSLAFPHPASYFRFALGHAGGVSLWTPLIRLSPHSLIHCVVEEARTTFDRRVTDLGKANQTKTAGDSIFETRREPCKTWLVTGAAGFIGSNLVEHLLGTGEWVTGLDNFSTGYRHNLEDVRKAVGDAAWSRFRLIDGDIRDPDICARCCDGAEYVLHQAALGSVPRSIKDPRTTHEVNADGFVNMLIAARDSGVSRFVYASSSSVYGDHPDLPKLEDKIGTPLSPYAVTKRTNELYARTFQIHYGLEVIGLRYFNVFGRRQDPSGAYAAVIPKWIALLASGESCTIFGDGETSRDFCYIANVVQANICAALAPSDATGSVYNVACGERTSLKELFSAIVQNIKARRPDITLCDPLYGSFRAGDVRHSLADITKAKVRLGYEPTHTAEEGLRDAIEWYLAASVGNGLDVLAPSN